LNADVSITDTDDATVLLHERTGRYYQLNATGGQVLRGLIDGRAVELIADELAVRYRIDRGQAVEDVARVVAELRSAELVIGP